MKNIFASILGLLPTFVLTSASQAANTAVVNQSGGGLNRVTITQSGPSNQAVVTQEGANNELNVTQSGDRNYVSRTQTGNSQANIQQNDAFFNESEEEGGSATYQDGEKF